MYGAGVPAALGWQGHRWVPFQGKSCVWLPHGAASAGSGCCSPGFGEALLCCAGERTAGASALGEDVPLRSSDTGHSELMEMHSHSCVSVFFSPWTHLPSHNIILVAISPVLLRSTHLVQTDFFLCCCSSPIRLTTWFLKFNTSLKHLLEMGLTP